MAKEIRASFRLSYEEEAFLKKKQEELGLQTFSEFVREALFASYGYHGPFIRKQLRGLQYEIRKIGTNINQSTKRINMGIGSPKDVEDLQSDLNEVKELLEKHREEVGKLWRSQN